MMNEYHQPVLLNESIEWLNVIEKGIYVDATFGGGGHSRAILSTLKDGYLYAFDCDKDVIKNIPDDSRFRLIRANFKYLKNSLSEHGVTQIDGLLADLGVSSHQLDTENRGFSIRFDAELDMRMDQSGKLTAAKIIQTYSAAELKSILSRYGEIQNSGRIAHAIETERKKKAIRTTSDLIQLLKRFVKPESENKFFARVFQALRIEVNDELGALKNLLEQAAEIIVPGGRLVIISYHSLEDRMVKNFMRYGDTWGEPHKDIKGNLIRPFNPILKKPLTAGIKEISCNPRSKSAKMRVAEKINLSELP